MLLFILALKIDIMKAFTDIEQSRKLAKILPIESADMCFNDNEPCWSLTALLNVLPNTMLGKDKDGYVVMVETMGSGLTAFASDPIDACVQMILKLHELKML